MKKSQRLRLPFVTGCAGIFPALAKAITVERAIFRNAAASSGPTGHSGDLLCRAELSMTFSSRGVNPDSGVPRGLSDPAVTREIARAFDSFTILTPCS